MNKAQKKQFEILQEVDRLCRKHNIKYVLCAGTMLGAIRHKGFIPWDDDIDIEMPRKDYEKFKEIALKEMDKKYFYQDIETDNNYGMMFAKVRINNTKYIEEVAKKNQAHNGIYIDIFPIDNYSSDNNKEFMKVVFLRMLLLLKNKYIIKANTIVKKIELVILKILVLFVSKKYLIKAINKIIEKNRIDTEYVCNYSTTYFDKVPFKKKWFVELEEYEFEGHKFMGTKYYDEYLSFLYGDYMKLPPKEKRITHDIIEIDYGK